MGSLTTAPDWSVLDLEGVNDVATSAARRVSDQYASTIEYDDALQEALIHLAGEAALVREYVADEDLGLGKLHHRLVQRLSNKVVTEAGHRATHTSFERMLELEQ